MSRDPASRPDAGNQDQGTAAHPPTQLGDQALPEAARAEHMEERESKEGRGRSARAAACHAATSSFSHCAPAGVRPKGLGWPSGSNREGLMAKG